MTENDNSGEDKRRDFGSKYGEPSERYRYKVIVGTYNTPAQFVNKMNGLGKVGWEIIDLHRNEFGAMAEVILKRYQDIKSVAEVSERYRYKVIRGTYDAPAQFVNKMNGLGDAGWEILDVHRNEVSSITEVILKMYQDVKSEAEVSSQEATYE